jgi:dTDP-4-dehydrorhamnose 3,5-epimerase
MPTRLIKTKRVTDDRGWFAETYSARALAAYGIEATFVQDNHSFSRAPGVLRGLHFQTPPHAQAKFVRCVRGAVWDVAVDIRAGSPTFGNWVAAELSAENGDQLFIPAGFAHGFVTLLPDTEVLYKVTDFYAPQSESGLIWNDPDLALPWPLPAGGPILSDKDRLLPRLTDLQSPFPYDGEPMTALGFCGSGGA